MLQLERMIVAASIRIAREKWLKQFEAMQNAIKTTNPVENGEENSITKIARRIFNGKIKFNKMKKTNVKNTEKLFICTHPFITLNRIA